MKKISNYNILEKIDETRGSLIYRASKENDEKTYIIKELKSVNPTPSEIARFKNEYEIIKKLNIKGVIRTYDILEYDGKIALVLEDFHGHSLKQILEERKLDLRLFLKIAVKCAEAVGYIHRENIVHRDLKPKNILINLETDELRIVDFGIANELTHENTELYHPHVIAGTLAYMSPEQTGRMNRQTDYRSDMYSLGITFYELLTGNVPFKSYDPMEVIHYHIAVAVKPLVEHDASIPLMISDIVAKLLSKMPEDRYQNCFGLMSDLNDCLNQLEKTGTITDFELGKNDVSPMFIFPQMLIGREKEIDVLLQTIESACSSGERNEMLLVSGSPGIGKSALINEAQKLIFSKKGYFISGKFGQFRRDVPYSAIIQAFQGLVNQILSEGSERIERWKESLLKTLGPNGRVITDVIPEIELIIGEQPEIPALGPEQNQNRFNHVFGSFAGLLASEDHPIVLFLDDLQWADMASLNLIYLIITDKEIQNFLIIEAYRDNEVSESHPLMMSLEKIKETGVSIHSIHLDVLDCPKVNEMVYRFLRRREKDTLSLAEIVHRKTNGNPFFVKEFMRNLYQDHMLQLEPLSGWQWDIEKIGAAQITDNVVELLAHKMIKLPRETQMVLKICACIGNSFDLETISKIYNHSIDDTLKEISLTVNEGILRNQDNIYCFQHDRIQEAAYSIVSENEKASLHYLIGNYLLDSTREEDLQDKILFIVDQLNAGKTLVFSEQQRVDLAGLNLRAGNKAKSSAAYESALSYFKTGIELIQFIGPASISDANRKDDCWEKEYRLTLSLHSDAAEAAYLSANYDEMEKFCKTVLKHAQSLIDKTNIFETQIHACVAQYKLIEAIDTGVNALKSFGIRFPKKPNILHIIIGLIGTKLRLRGKDNKTLLELPMIQDPLMQGAISLIAAISPAAYWAKPDLLPLTMFKLIEITLKYGNNSQSPALYCGYGLILCSLDQFDSGYNSGRIGLSLLERMNIKEQMPRTHFIMAAFIQHWKEFITRTIEPLYGCYHRGLELGELEWVAYSAMVICEHQFYSGQEISGLERDIARLNDVVEKIKQKSQFQIINLYLQLFQNLAGKTDVPYSLTGKKYDEEKMLPVHVRANDQTAIAIIYINKLILCYLFNEYLLALEYSKLSESHIISRRATYQFSLVYFYDSLTRLALYDSSSWYEKKKTLVRIARNQKKIKKWMLHNPANQSNKYYLIEAERMRVLGRHQKAIEYYHKSIVCARENRFIHEEGIAHECAARFLMNDNNEIFARMHIQAAHDCYSKWGAVAKVNQLNEKYPHLLNKISREGNLSGDIAWSNNVEITDSSTSSSTETLDLSTLMKAAQTLSSEIDLKKLLEKMMKMLLETAGAQKGFLILENRTDNKLYIEAEAFTGKPIRTLESVPLEISDNIPCSIVNFVNKIKSTIVLNDASESGKFANDPYIEKNKPRSILCGPVIYKGNMSGIIYLENNLTTNAFSHERKEILRLLSSQAAISIENARLVDEKLKNEKFSAIGQMAGGIVHDLKNPITSIKAYAEMVRDFQITEESKNDYLTIIEKEADRLSDMAQSILDFVKGDMRLNLESVDLKVYIDDAAKFIKPVFEADSKNLYWQIDRSGPVTIDQDRMRRVIINLANNAREVLESGGNFTIHASLEDKLILQFTDDGPGIPAQIKDKLFQPFATHGKAAGTGLGLAMVRQIVEAHGGTVTCESPIAEGRGVRFVVVLPVE